MRGTGSLRFWRDEARFISIPTVAELRSNIDAHAQSVRRS